jgi:hypothetical protein
MSSAPPVKVHVIVEQDGNVLSHMNVEVSGGRHEFTFLTPVRVPIADSHLTRHFEGFALEMHIDQETRRVVYDERLVHRPALELKR